MSDSLLVNEIFLSLQGESSHAGFPTVFIRLAGCNLRCNYCDTAYAWEEGERMSMEQVIEKVGSYRCKRVEITGGEPMKQENTVPLSKKLLDKNYHVMLETNGTVELTGLPDGIIKVVDIKCPESGSGETFLESNLDALNKDDEIKFVVSSKSDFKWALEMMQEHNLPDCCTVNMSPVTNILDPQILTQWILESGHDLRLNLQIHQFLHIP